MINGQIDQFNPFPPRGSSLMNKLEQSRRKKRGFNTSDIHLLLTGSFVVRCSVVYTAVNMSGLCKFIMYNFVFISLLVSCRVAVIVKHKQPVKLQGKHCILKGTRLTARQLQEMHKYRIIPVTKIYDNWVWLSVSKVGRHTKLLT